MSHQSNQAWPTLYTLCLCNRGRTLWVYPVNLLPDPLSSTINNSSNEWAIRVTRPGLLSTPGACVIIGERIGPIVLHTLTYICSTNYLIMRGPVYPVNLLPDPLPSSTNHYNNEWAIKVTFLYHGIILFLHFVLEE